MAVALVRMQVEIDRAEPANCRAVSEAMRAEALQPLLQIRPFRPFRAQRRGRTERHQGEQTDRGAQALTAGEAARELFASVAQLLICPSKINRSIMPESKSSDHLSERRPGDTHSAARLRVLVLGASGFIGRRVVQSLAASDWAMPVAASHRTALDLPIAVEAVQLDARRASAVQDALRGAAGVVNCITGDAATIIAGARALFAACARLTPPPRVVHLSTMMVYGTATGTVDETAPLKGDWDDYSRAKAEVEHMSRACPAVVHLRPGIVYGPGSPIWVARIGRWLLQHRLGDLSEAGLGFCNLVHVDDVVQAILQALRMPGIEGEAFNLAAPAAPTWNEYFRQFAAALGTPLFPISRLRLQFEQHILAPPLKIAEILSRIWNFGWRPPDPIRPWLMRLCGQRLRLDARKAERMLGIQWTPLDRGLRDSAAWFLGQTNSNKLNNPRL